MEVEEIKIAPREILHSDSLNRDESVLRELITNLAYLEEDLGPSHQ